MMVYINGLKEEVIEYIEKGVSNAWNIIHIGIIIPGTGSYENYSETLSEKHTSLEEYGNQPLFILESKNVYKT